jgi:SlyX protein
VSPREDRIDGIETHLAHLQRAIEDLSDVVARQDREIDQLRRHLRELQAIEADRRAGEGPAADQRPPHW